MKKTPLADEYLMIASSLPEEETDPFFYTRLSARLERTNKRAYSFSLRPQLLIGVLALLLFMNGFVFMKETKSSPQTSSGSLQTFASSYDLTITTPY